LCIFSLAERPALKPAAPWAYAGYTLRTADTINIVPPDTTFSPTAQFLPIALTTSVILRLLDIP
jgi:hypothetical protein